MRRLFLSTLLGCMIALLLFASALYAQDYVINLTINGTPVALSVTIDDGDLTVDTAAAGVTVVSILTPTPTPTAAANSTATANSNANLRSGPGTSYAVAGNVKAGQVLTIIGKDATGNWLELADGTWIAAFLVTVNTGNPSAQSTPTKSAPTATPTPAVAQTSNLKKAILAALDKPNRDTERLAYLELDPTGTLFVEWAINDSFWINDTAREEVVTILKAIHASGLPYKLVSMTGTFSMQDSFGNTSESTVVFLTFPTATLEKINWNDNTFISVTLPKNIYELAEMRNVHPELQ